MSLTKHPTIDISNPTDAALIAMKLFIAKAMPTKLTHTPTMPILIPFIQSHSFVKFKLTVSELDEVLCYAKDIKEREQIEKEKQEMLADLSDDEY